MPGKSQPNAPSRVRQSVENISRLLAREKIDLTIGGEPTFVPLQPEGDEWGTGALGPTKLIYARKMARSLVEMYYPGALISLHSGKHYPGEPIPRWQLTVQWRDNRPLWKSPDRLLLAPPATKRPPVRMAGKMIRELAAQLKLTRFVRPLLEKDATRARAWVLPLSFDFDSKKWISASWTPKGKTITLIPGDSSAGLRMPLDDLSKGSIRTALTVSACCDGALEIFIPPLKVTPYDTFLKLVEKTANRLDVRNLVISGYLPEGCHHGQSLSMVSDPGVLEINLPPSKTWAKHCRIIKQIYAAAKSNGMRAEKFLHNGEHLGTGGGSHLCFGASSPDRSPFTCVPHLLPSIIRYWNHHPSLSYLFTGLFVGPGSQAPRVDESNPHLIAELEIALQDIPKTAWNPTELHQRIIHFFIDASGNTHRSEISMDKLSNPLMKNGSLGIIEFRAIESQPDPKQWGLIVLLFQAIIARLVKHPFRKPMRHPTPSFQDRYFLPTVLEADLNTVLKDLKKMNVHLKPEDFLSHRERRFPLCGELASEKTKIVIRKALESWPLLSELPSEQTTMRPVDSSFARIECRMEGPPASIQSLSRTSYLRINGKTCSFRNFENRPLLGLKFRTFNQPDGFHPHIPGQCPLHFEWIDARSGEILDEGVWHHWNPYGEQYEDRPTGIRDSAARSRERWIKNQKKKRPPYRPGMPPCPTSHLTDDLRRK